MDRGEYLILNHILSLSEKEAQAVWKISHEEALDRLNKLMYKELSDRGLIDEDYETGSDQYVDDPKDE